MVVESDTDMAHLAPLEDFKGPLSQRVYHSLRKAILALKIKPGTKLHKAEICDHFGVSRSPVSEALAKLSGEGLVDIVPQSGTTVTLLSLQEIQEASFMREALEVACVSHVAEHRTDSQLSALKRNFYMQQILVKENDYSAFYEIDEEFHEMIMDFTGYQRVAQMVDTISATVIRARLQLIPTPGRIEETFKEHTAILEAIQANDPSQARNAMRAHLHQLVPRLIKFADEQPELFQDN